MTLTKPSSIRQFPALIGLVFLLATAPGIRAQEDHPVEDAAKFKLQVKANKSLPTLYLVGDSTMKVGTPGQRGWGEEMAKYFDLTKINVVNQAIGGRSSRTFQTEGRWAAVVDILRKGDCVIIEFGHNDGGSINEKPPVTPSTRARGTIKGVGEETQEIDNILTGKHETVHSFGWYIRKYVNDTKAKGAVPIVMSLVPRNSWKDGKVNRAAPNGYGEWARLAAEATGSRFVDHNEIIARELEKIGPEQALPLFGDGKLHASPVGAEFNARAAIAGLKALPGNPFKRYFSAAARDIPPFAGVK
jgi:rhamnogalacturonan acetylesterase